MSKITAEILIKMGMPMRLRGFKYIVEAVDIASAEGEVYGALTKIIYKTIAKKHKKSVGTVEKSIRTAISKTWDGGDLQFLREVMLAGNCVFFRVPTNGEFISCLCDYECIFDGETSGDAYDNFLRA